MTIAIPAPRADQIPRGIFYMVGATFAFSATNALIKLQVAKYPIGEVAFFRSAFALVACAAIVLPRTGLTVLRTEHLGGHLKRSISQFFGMMTFFIALALMPLADVTSITFSSPLFATLLSALVLRERVGIHRWSALVMGFAGVILVAHPGAGSLQWGALLALANALLFASVTIAVRRMSRTESTATLTTYQLVFITLFAAGALPFGFRWPAWPDFLMMVLAGFGNGLGQWWWTKALHLAPASAVVPFNYFSLVWVTIAGYLLWRDLPSPATALGAAIVVASGLYILWRETLHRRRAAATRATGDGNALAMGGATQRAAKE